MEAIMNRQCLLAAVLVICSAIPSAAGGQGPGIAGKATGDYVVLGWNDLGMHCINPSYKELAILPPANNLWVQVVKRGDPPVIVTTGVTMDYSIVNNRKVTGKTDFWQYAEQLFGIRLPEGVGLTGNGLSGTLHLVDNHFEATAIPALPYDDAMNWNPYQTAVIKLQTAAGGTPRKTKVVLPVSDELNCSQCHAQGMDATGNIGGGSASVDTNILAIHDYYHGTSGLTSTGPDLLKMRPVLCASCHADNAIGRPGDGHSLPLSQAMHGWHAQFPDAGCYSCHPGEATQCLRTGIGGMGYLGDEPSCQAGLCHGGMSQVANSIGQGREPWLQEPSCEQCHGSNYATGQDLYRHVKGHGGLLCAACHNSPHAWWPSKMWADNLQPVKLQHSTTAIGDCSVCHTRKLDGHNPHVTYLPATGDARQK
jgi:hypothetical protein